MNHLKYFFLWIAGILLTLNALSNSPDFTLRTLEDNYLTMKSDSISKLFPEKAKGISVGIKPLIAPAVLISGGTAIHFMTGFKENVRDYFQENLYYTGHFDDYAQYAPVVAVYALNLCGVKGKNGLGNRTAILVKSVLINRLLTGSVKEIANVTRPNGFNHSFPSGHTSMAFSLAHFMHHEYGQRSVWFSIGAYACASAVGVLRISKNAHWVSDVVGGAGFGILSTELAYLTHRYKWDKNKKNNLSFSPFQFRDQKGIAMVYRF